MIYYDWKKEIIKKYQNDNSSKLEQFNIEIIDEKDLLYSKFLENNIYAINKNNYFNNFDKIDEKNAIVVGFGNSGLLHIGHFLLAKELLFYIKNNSKIYFVNLDPDNDNVFVYQILDILKSNYSQKIDYEILTCNDIDILKLKKKIASNLSVNMIDRVMGWKSENLQSYEKALDMMATFSLSDLIPENNKIIITDINQVTFYGLIKNIENRLQIELPNYTYHLLLPSLKSPDERMSVKKSKSLVFIDDDESEIEKKLKGSFTGTVDRQLTCSFLRVIDLINSVEETERVILNCNDCNFTCSECKKNNINKLVKKIKDKRII